MILVISMVLESSWVILAPITLFFYFFRNVIHGCIIAFQLNSDFFTFPFYTFCSTFHVFVFFTNSLFTFILCTLLSVFCNFWLLKYLQRVKCEVKSEKMTMWQHSILPECVWISELIVRRHTGRWEALTHTERTWTICLQYQKAVPKARESEREMCFIRCGKVHDIHLV